MFGPLTLKVILYSFVFALGASIGWQVNGWRLESRINKIQADYAKAFADAKQKSIDQQNKLQASADRTRKEQNEKLQSLQRDLDSALSSLRNRPSQSDSRNTSNSGTGQTSSGCTGAELFRENAEDLIREAVRAEKIRQGLTFCYKQYDSIIEVLNSKKGK